MVEVTSEGAGFYLSLENKLDYSLLLCHTRHLIYQG